jgi:uncharacterized membrane protein YccF (DUF307 family)
MGIVTTAIQWTWFITVGWMLGLAWAFVAILLMASIVFYPFGTRMITRTRTVALLQRPRYGKMKMT